jgi:hypothetical protein
VVLRDRRLRILHHPFQSLHDETTSVTEEETYEELRSTWGITVFTSETYPQVGRILTRFKSARVNHTNTV